MSSAPLQLPESEREHGMVVCRVARRVADSPADEDALPDLLPAKGHVRFTPLDPLTRSERYSALIIHEVIDAPLDDDGHMVVAPDADKPGIWLPLGAYRVEFVLDKGRLPSTQIMVQAVHDEGAPLDLAHAIEYQPPAGVKPLTLLVPADIPDGKFLTKQGDRIGWVEPFAKGDSGPAGPAGVGIETIEPAPGGGGITVTLTDGTQSTYHLTTPDTGWVDVAGSLMAGWAMHPTAGLARIRRVGDTVHLELRLKPGEDATEHVLRISPGFLPGGYLALGQSYGTASTGFLLTASGTSTLSLRAASGSPLTGQSVSGTATWLTRDNWPTP